MADKKPMSLKQARAMRDGILKGDSAMSQAWKEILGQVPEGSPPDASSWEEISKAEGTDKERLALGIPLPDEEEEF